MLALTSSQLKLRLLYQLYYTILHDCAIATRSPSTTLPISLEELTASFAVIWKHNPPPDS